MQHVAFCDYDYHERDLIGESEAAWSARTDTSCSDGFVKDDCAVFAPSAALGGNSSVRRSFHFSKGSGCFVRTVTIPGGMVAICSAWQPREKEVVTDGKSASLQ